ncbi:efflux RND transporter periplasmic adaptor subunit [Paludisphaera borealis]|uniref:Macrolide export protein MacA n=1 Tax=Paludisphaera borealis TaxID=1387353 RepID=A0A1U7CMP1_9BACT|nr:efflux RND transporter periplasmic adaptor subunit [Paludisphaera borealis]APW60202.1 Macrolide export protein MacA [Paludisphaera borealis]
MNFSLQNTEDPASAQAPVTRDLPALQRPKRRRPSLGKLLTLGLVASLAVAGVALVSVPGLSKPFRTLFAATSIEIVPHEIKLGALPITVTEKGALESSKNDDVSCLVEGQTTIIMILPEGTRVKKGQLVCELDSAALRDSLTNQKIATQGAEASYQQAKLTREVAEIAVKEYEEGVYLQDKATIKGEIKLAESEMARSEDRVAWAARMFEKGYVSRAQKVSEELNYQKAGFALEQAQGKLIVLDQFTKAKTIKELRSDVEKAHSDELAKEQTLKLERDKEAKYEKQIVNCKLYAPNDGLIVYANDAGRSFGSNAPQIEEGATVRERQKIFSLPDIANMQVNAKVHESQIDKITPNMQARIRVDAFADTELIGHVVDVAPLPDQTSFFSSDIKVYTTRIKIDKPLPGLRPGMNAEVVILVDRKEDVLSVPVQAILEYGGKDHVAVRTGDGYERKEVTLGATNDKFVEVTQGVSAGMFVALNPVVLLSDAEKRELFGAGRGASKKAWGGAEKGAPGAPGEAGKAGPAGALGAPGAPAGKTGDFAKAKAKGARKGGGAGGGIFAKIPAEDRAKLKGATEEERAAIFKKAGITEAEIEQMKQMRQNGGGGPGGGGGGGFGGGGGGGGGGAGGPGGGGN